MGKLLTLTTSPAARAALIDELGDLKAKKAAFAPTEKRLKQVSDEVASWYDDRAPAETYVEKGYRYQLTVSARLNVTSVNIRAVYRILGVRKFLDICTVTLTAIREVLTDAEVLAVTSLDRTGYRRLDTTPLGTPAELSSGSIAHESDQLPKAA